MPPLPFPRDGSADQRILRKRAAPITPFFNQARSSCDNRFQRATKIPADVCHVASVYLGTTRLKKERRNKGINGIIQDVRDSQEKKTINHTLENINQSRR